MKSLSTWKLIHQSLEQDIPVMLLYVIQSAGSSPGRQGFFMAVNATGSMEGSLGGGIMEHKFVEMSKVKLQQAYEGTALHKQIHNTSAGKHRSGMICSGEQTILVHRVRGCDNIPVNHIITCLEQGTNGLMRLLPSGIQFNETQVPGRDFIFLQRTEEDWEYEEKIGYKNHLHIIGGGHCALALSQIMQGLDFYIHIYDNRRDLNTMDQNGYVHQKHILEEYDALSLHVQSGKNQYVVIMTFGYRTDSNALSALIDKDLKYLGLLGSVFKIEKMMNDLRGQGISEDRIRRIYAPVGIAIKSQTPEEVAVSIAAEIIKVKNG
ncbi:MAG: XdhC family protein [Chitinophagaceae bacterium]